MKASLNFTRRANANARQLGAALMEFALAATIFFMLLFGVVLWGLTMWEINTLHFAVERGARCAILPVPVTGTKLCVAGDTANDARVAAQAGAYGLSGGAGSSNALIGKNNFVEESRSVSVNGTSSFGTACMKTDSVPTFVSSVGLIFGPSAVKSVVYCRPTQN